MVNSTSLHCQSSFNQHIEAYVLEKMEEMLDVIPLARDFHEGKWIEEEYYKRHIIETVIRIRLNNELDAYCLHKIDQNNGYVFGSLAKYLAEEYGHGTLFLSDLIKLGVSQEEALETPPFLSTQLLIGYIYLMINKNGAIAGISWNWFVEWYSNRYNKIITKKAAKEFGFDKVEGNIAHLRIDESEDHKSFMFSLIERSITEDNERDRVREYLTNFVRLVGMYFQELYDTTIKPFKNE